MVFLGQDRVSGSEAMEKKETTGEGTADSLWGRNFHG